MADQSGSIGFDGDYFKSIPGILRIAQGILGFLYWVILATYPCYVGGRGWVMFVGVWCWIFTGVFYVIFLLGIQRKITVINWVITELINNGLWCLFHLIAAIVASVAAGDSYCWVHKGKIIFVAIDGWVLIVLYGISLYFNIRDFQAAGGISSLNFGGSSTTQQQSGGSGNAGGVDPPPPYPEPPKS